MATTTADQAGGGKTLGERRVAFYSSMYLPISVALLPVGVYVQPHYAELGISLTVIAAIIFGARISDVFTDPLIGVLSGWIAWRRAGRNLDD